MSERAPLSMLPLFAGPAPSVPSPTSETAADAITKGPFRTRSYRAIIAALAAHGPMTREALSSVTGYKEASLCARLWELGPVWVECRDGAGRSKAGLSVNEYALTPACRERMTQELGHGG